MITIMGDKYQCKRCGKYWYVNEGAGMIIVPNCPFCWGSKVPGKFIQTVKITM
jgi:hypothetical protein